jgi:hypothetical protein
MEAQEVVELHLKINEMIVFGPDQKVLGTDRWKHKIEVVEVHLKMK